MKTALLFLVLCGLLSSCDCTDFDQVSISERNIPDTVTNNENVKIRILAEAYNGCWGNLYVKMNRNDENNYTIEAYGTKYCCTCICPAVIVFHDTIIVFRPPNKGIYYFRIWETTKRSVMDTLVVE